MKTNDLAKWCMEHPDVDVFVANHILDDDGNIVDLKYFDLEFNIWDAREPETSHWIINPGELVSG